MGKHGINQAPFCFKRFHLFCLLIAVFAFGGLPSAQAADAVRLYLELSSTTATIWPGGGTEYIRGRVMLLDANNELATTFAGRPITDCQLLFQSQRFGSQAQFSFQPATDLDLSGTDWESGAESVSKRPERAWQEFAISYDNVSEIDNDTLIITLKTGSSTLATQREIKVQGPPANCYVVRTGGGPTNTLDLLDIIPPQNNDDGAVKPSGASVNVKVYAAYYSSKNGNYYYTNNIPDEYKTVSVGGTTITLDNGFGSGTVSQTVTGTASDVSEFNHEYMYGTEKSFSASPTASDTARWIGIQVDDVTRTSSGNEYVYVTGQTQLAEGSSSDTKDTAKYKPTSVATKITIVGLPVNEVDENGNHKESGTGLIAQNPGKAEIKPNDAFILLGNDKTKKPTVFKTAGKKSPQTYIYGAIVGYDNDNNPASFAQGLTATFYLKQKGGTAVNASGSVLRAVTLTSDNQPVYYSGPAAGTTSSDGTAITAKYAYQCFLPFQITATAADGTASLEKLYIDKIKLSDGSELSRSIYENVDSENEGVTFIAQDKIGAITLTDISNLDGANAGDDAEVKIKGINGEKDFDLRVINGSSDLQIGDKGSSSSGTSVTLSADSDGVAKKDVAFFTALVASITAGSTQVTAPIFAFKGLNDGTNVVQGYPRQPGDSIAMEPARPGKFDISSLSAGFATIKSYLDPQYNHDTLFIEGGASASDAFSNSYDDLKDADVSAGVYLPASDGSASTTPFSGASARIDGKNIVVKFNPDNITPEQDTAVVKFTSRDGKTASTTIKLRAAQKVKLSSLFVPVPGVTDTPVAVSLADQNDTMIEPITVTAANDTTDKGKYGNKITIELEADNGTINGLSETSVTVKTTAPTAVITAKTDTGKDSMLITGKADDFSTGTLLLSFVPDFEKPVIADIIEGNCRIDIELTDNQALDLEGSEITVFNASGEDITRTLSISSSYGADTTSGTITVSGFPVSDQELNYTVTVNARDQWNNEREVMRIVAVACIELPTSCLEVDPAYGIKGETKTVTIKAENTNFMQGTTQVSFSCDNATVTGTEVKSPTEVVVTVQIGGTAPPVSSDVAVVLPSLAQETSGTTTTTTTPSTPGSEICSITVTTGSEVLTCSDAFEILSEPKNPQCLGVSPSSVTSGQTADIVITGTDTSFADTTAVSLSCSEITVTGKKADSATQMTVSISSTPVETTTTCAVTVGDLSCGELTLLPSTGPGTCKLSSISRNSVRAGRFLPRVFLVTIRGTSNCSFANRPTVSFGTSSITALPLVAIRNTVVCLVTVRPGTPSGNYEVTVDGIGGVTFTVQ